MPRCDHHFDVCQLTADAKSVLRDLELERYREDLEELRRMAEDDPMAPYRLRRWYPRYVVWELTLACNMRCQHCGSSAGRKRSDELRRDELLRVCDELGELGCERVTLLGGEPLIHPHWEAIARRTLENGYRANVITNGWELCEEALCDRLAAAELSIVGVSVDGLEHSHDALRRREGSFARIGRGMELLRERGVPVAVATAVTNAALDEIEELHAWLRGHHVRVWQLQIACPLGRLQRDDPALVRPERLDELLDFVARARDGASGAGPRVDIADNVGYYTGYEDLGLRQRRPGQAFHWTGCHAGIQALGIESNGDVKGCQSLPSIPRFIEGNLRERSLADIWNDPEAFGYTRRFERSQLSGACARCDMGPLCKAGCSSSAYSHSGHIGDNPMCIYRVSEL